MSPTSTPAGWQPLERATGAEAAWLDRTVWAADHPRLIKQKADRLRCPPFHQEVLHLYRVLILPSRLARFQIT
jgi:hypothetical protein